MAYDNNNKTDNRQNVNTRSQTYRDGNSQICENTALVVSFWEDLVKFAFTSELPKAMQTESRRWDYDSQVVTCVPREKANELYNIYWDYIKPAIVDKRDESAGITVGGTNLIVLGNKIKDDKCHPYIALYKNLNPDTRMAESCIMYEFNMGEVIIGYSPEDGTFKEAKTTTNEIEVFIKDLDDFRSATSKSYVHASRCVDKAFKDMLINNNIAIGKKLGVDLTLGNNNGNRGQSFTGSIFNRNSGSSNNAISEEVITDLDDLPF